MKELIQKGLKNREEMIARQKEFNSLEMQALRDVKGKKSRQIDQQRGPIKEATTLADAEVAELFSMKKDTEDLKGMTTSEEDKDINWTLHKLEEQINNTSHRLYTIQEVNSHKEMLEAELDHTAQEVALEAHGLHIANPEELDKPILVDIVPSLPVE